MKNPFFYILLSALLVSCLLPDEPEAESLTLISWNVQNLFDAVSDGFEYPEYDPSGSDWNEQKMRIKLENLKEVLLSLDGGLPDILLLQEVENRNILEILNEEYLDGYYSFSDCWKDSNSAIGCGVLSRIVPDQIHIHFPGEYRGRALRPLAEIHFSIASEELVVFNNHWKSRGGGQMATEEGRIMASELLSRRIRELREEGVKNLIVTGDLNGSCEDYRSGGSQCAQIPVEEIFDIPWDSSLLVSYDSADTWMESSKVILYSPWKDMDSEGSYFFQNRWMKLDHFLLDRGLLDNQGLEYFDSACVVLPVNSDDQGLPLVWESWRGAGCSDHFPVFLSLGFSEKSDD